MGKHRLSIAKKSLLAAKPVRVKPKSVKQPRQLPSRGQGADAQAPGKAATERLRKQEERQTKAEPQVRLRPADGLQFV